jgi:HAD superfamily hydrolase (TIGR01459 family)
MTSSPIALRTHFSDLAADYDVVLSDVWGVVHNGVEAFPAACDALIRFRAAGGKVVLITNSPRPTESVIRQLGHLRVPAHVYDGLVSSGELTRGVIRAREGQTVFHMGPARDAAIFTGLDVAFAPLERADYVVCSGLFDDEHETPEDYRARLEGMRARHQFMVCGNPDVVVERGEQLLYCAGALADLYQAMGGEVLYAGKPYRPIYDEAMRLAAAAGAKTQAPRVLAIGDSVRTDLSGAQAFGIDCLFITAGIHAEELGARETPDPDALAKIFAAAGTLPKAVMRRLVW